jgi:hypothetical protein
LGASSDSGTPFCATWSAVARCPGVIGKFCAKALPVIEVASTAAAQTSERRWRKKKNSADWRVCNGMKWPLSGDRVLTSRF